MGFKCGIVGLPNVGKSTLFNALTQAAIEAANYPFCTIDPNIGVVNVPDPRLEKLTRLAKPKQTVAAVMQFVDIAGLVKGAASGEGLGNKFLANIRETDAIAHVVRCFEHSDIVHVGGKVDPIDDIETITTELILADMDTVEKALLKAQKNSKSGNKEAIFEKQALEKLKAHLDTGLVASSFENFNELRPILDRLCLLTAKPVLYIANTDDNNDTNPHVQRVVEYAKKQGSSVVSICAATEADLIEMDESDRQDFMDDLGLTEPGLHRVIRAGYELLGLQTYFTVGEKEVRAWTIRKGMTAQQAAGVIHTDFAKGFIRAEVIGYEDFVNCGGEQKAKDLGKLRLEGKEYIVKDGDIMHFRFNV